MSSTKTKRSSFPRLNPAAQSLRMQIFGPFALQSEDGQQIRFSTKKSAALVAYLAMCGEKRVLRKRAEALLWSNRFQEQSNASLRQSLSDIRRSFASAGLEILIADRNFIGLDLDKIVLCVSLQNSDIDLSLDKFQLLLEDMRGISIPFDGWIESLLSTGQVEFRKNWLKNINISTERDENSSVIIKKFTHVGSGSALEGLSQELTFQIASALSRHRWLTVAVSGNGQLERAAYYINGSLIEGAGGYLLTISLVSDAKTVINAPFIIWNHSEEISFDLDYSQIYKCAGRIAAAVDPEIVYAESKAIALLPDSALTARGKLMRAVVAIYDFDRDAWRESEQLLLDCVRMRPDSARVNAYLALSLLTGVAQGWAPNVAKSLAESSQFAKRAQSLDPHDSIALSVRAHLLSFVEHRFEEADSLFVKALAKNPNCGISQMYHSITLSYMERCEESKISISRAKDCLIYDPYWSIINACEAIRLFFSKQYEESIVECNNVLVLRPSFTNIRKLLVKSYCIIGAYDLAISETKIIHQLENCYSWHKHLSVYPFFNPKTKESVMKACFNAGLLHKP